MSRPVRTCIGCRGKAEQAELLRLVWQDHIVVDARRREPGRGAYVHRDPGCVDTAVRRRSAGRALRVEGVDPAQLREAVASHLAWSA